MPRANIPADESQRLQCLRDCRILDTPPESVFDDLTQLAARLSETPIALVSLVDSERQWFKSAYGIDARETHRDMAFCAHAILSDAPFVVTDAANDPRTLDNPLVLGPPHIRFYAGVQLRTKSGYVLGTLCVIDTKPREISEQQLQDLKSLAIQVTSQLELRRLNSVLSHNQAQLQEVHTRLNKIASQVPGVVYQYELREDGTSCFPYASEGIFRIYRVTPEEVRADASKVFAVLHPDDYDAVVDSIRKSARDLSQWRHEYRVRFSDGDVRWLYGNATPQRQSNGSILWHGLITDETEQRKIRDEALLVRSRMQAVVQGSTQLSIIGTDLNGMITVFNSGAEGLLGYRAEEMIGLQTPEIIHLRSEVETRSAQLSKKYGYAVEGFETFVHSARRGGHSEADWTYVRKDGSHLTVHLVVTATRDEAGLVTGFVGVAADVTAARNTEATLRFERERLDMALTGGELGTWDWNIQTGREIWDSRFAGLLGERLEDLNQHMDEFTARVFPEDLMEVLSNVQKHLSGQSPIYEAEFRVRQKNGTWKWVQARGRLMERDVQGNPLRMLGTLADISARKKTEADLVKARVMADTANRSKSEFLANMSHEIRTPLTSILGYADLLTNSGLSDDEVAENVATIKSAGSHLLTIINDVLDLSKIEAGRMTVERIGMCPSHVVGEVLTVLRPAAHAKGLHLKVRSVGLMPRRIISDPVRLRQILMNIVGNAIKFTETGHVCVTAQMAPASPDGKDRLLLEVADTGIGMTKTQCDALFEPFIQADASTTRRFGGTGLGLAICRRMARILDGEITVRSEPGVGSTFRISIASGPVGNVEMSDSLAVENETPRGDEIRESVSVLHGSILLVEDNPVNSRLFRSLLQNAGADVETADNGQIAVEKTLRLMQSRPISQGLKAGYDLILMDMQMPVLDGYSAAKQLRKSGYREPIVALTAHALSEDRQKCLSAGCDDVATKPIEKTQLINICHKWMTDQRPRDLIGESAAENNAGVAATELDINAILSSVDGDMELLNELTDLFNVNAAELLDELQHAIEEKDCHVIARIAHSLKGAVGAFGARNAFNAAATVETLASAGDLNGAIEDFPRLKRETHHVLEGLRRFQTNRPTEEAARDAEPEVKTFATLGELCQF